MTNPGSDNKSPRLFPNTRWSVVLAATQQPSPESAAALETICRAYWYPLYAYVRHCGQSPHDAQDLTQDFFCRLLEKRWLDSVDPGKGKLRTFLVVLLKHFLSKEWRKESAQRRGGGQASVPIDTAFAESRLAAGADSPLGAYAVFDREWALTLLDLTMQRLEKEFREAGKAEEYSALKGCLAISHRSIEYGPLAEKLGLSEATTRVVVHRLRKRFRTLYREEIAQTLSDGSDLDAELRHLAAALAL
jgi:DNA-directed RNA polymerase specialized sigma24 family protein